MDSFTPDVFTDIRKRSSNISWLFMFLSLCAGRLGQVRLIFVSIICNAHFFIFFNFLGVCPHNVESYVLGGNS